MAIYRTISLSFWTDSKVDDEFTPEDKYFFLYLLTNPHSNLLGCYEISMKQMATEMGYSRDTIEHLIKRMSEYHHVIEYDKDTKEVLVLKWYKYNWTKSDKFLKSLLSILSKTKSERFRAILTETIGKVYGTDTVSVPYGDNYVSVSVTDTVTDKGDRGVGEEETKTEEPAPKKTKSKRAKVFTAPTVEEVRAYCQERKNQIDPEAFVDFYESKGWMIGKDKMRDWKAAVRTWEKRESFGTAPKKQEVNQGLPDWYAKTEQTPLTPEEQEKKKKELLEKLKKQEERRKQKEDAETQNTGMGDWPFGEGK